MTDEELQAKHEENCDKIVEHFTGVNLDSAVDWNKVEVKITNANGYINKDNRAEVALYNQFIGRGRKK